MTTRSARAEFWQVYNLVYLGRGASVCVRLVWYWPRQVTGWLTLKHRPWPSYLTGPITFALVTRRAGPTKTTREHSETFQYSRSFLEKCDKTRAASTLTALSSRVLRQGSGETVETTECRLVTPILTQVFVASFGWWSLQKDVWSRDQIHINNLIANDKTLQNEIKNRDNEIPLFHHLQPSITSLAWRDLWDFVLDLETKGIEIFTCYQFLTPVFVIPVPGGRSYWWMYLSTKASSRSKTQCHCLGPNCRKIVLFSWWLSLLQFKHFNFVYFESNWANLILINISNLFVG